MNIREHPDVVAFKTAAERYCVLFESEPADAEQWVEAVLSTLAQVYAAAVRLPSFGLDDAAIGLPDALDVTFEEWREVYRIVTSVLGAQEVYWDYFDPFAPPESDEQRSFHSLADDLADIYRDIQPGLRAWNTGEDAYLKLIVFDWKTPLFDTHWGIHAVSAMKPLHHIVYLSGLRSAD